MAGAKRFGRFYLDKEKDMVVDLYRENDEISYVLRTPNHHTGNLITNFAKLCGLPVSRDENGLKVIRGVIPCYVNGENRILYAFRFLNTKVANVFPDGRIERKASIPAIAKTLMSQTKEYRLDEMRTIIKSYIRKNCKFRTDLHTHMNGNLEPDVLVAFGIFHELRYPYYYIRKLELKLTKTQTDRVMKDRAKAAALFADSGLTGKYLDRKIDDHTFVNFADLILNNLRNAPENIRKIRNALTIPKDGQAVFTDLEKVYLYRYVFTKGVPSEKKLGKKDLSRIPDEDIRAYVMEMEADRKRPEYVGNTLFMDKLLWIGRTYARYGIDYVEISDTTLVKKEEAARMLAEAHRILPAVERETGVLIRFLASIRRIPLTIVKDRVTPNDYLAENLKVLRAVASDPYVAGSDFVGEEINDILELKPVITEIVKIANETPGFVIRIHAGENDSLRDNVANSIRCVAESLAPGQAMPAMRIGHGLYTCNLNTPKWRKLLNELKAYGVTLEFQITSNVRLNNLSDLDRYPLKGYLRAGVRCVQGTDGGALYGTDSIDEELSLEKLLGLSEVDLLRMKETEEAIETAARRTFETKKKQLEEVLSGSDVESFFSDKIKATPAPKEVLWIEKEKCDAAKELSHMIRPLDAEKLPVILAGGSFNNDRHQTRVTPEGKALIDRLLALGDP